MPYMLIEDFASGVDLRRSAVTAEGRSLRKLVNGFVNAGGEIEKRRAFVTINGTLAGTYGLKGAGIYLWVFGSAATAPAGLPQGVAYHALVGANIARIADVEIFNGLLYVVVQQPDGNFAHYYNGAHVTEAPNSGTVMAHRSKMYSVKDNIVYFSGLDDPLHWTADSGGTVGAGFIQVDAQDDGSVTLVGLASYYDQLALFGRNSVQLWSMDEDPKLNQLIQTVGNIGLVTPQGVGRYATGDVLFLHDSGIRSLRARDSSNAASVNDIGSPIDEEIRALVRAAKAENPGAVSPRTLVDTTTFIDPDTGQFWLSMGNSIYVLSIAASSKVSAWSRFDPGFKPQYFAPTSWATFLRSGDTLYAYSDGYDNSLCEVITPMIPANKPATNKMFSAMDAAIEGTWSFEVGTDPSNPDTRDPVATITGPSFSQQSIGMQNSGTHIGVRMTATDPSRARIGNMLFHYREGVVD